MLFSSIVFIFYFLPVALVLYYVFHFHTGIKNLILLMLSLFFYAWGEPKFVFVMLVSILLNYIYGLLIDKFRTKKKIAITILVAMCVTNLGVLFVYKYLAFALDIYKSIFGGNHWVPYIALPIGISFFTFQAMSYVIDVYRENSAVQKNPFYLALYISFFPQLVAGPIVRYETVANQILNRKETMDKFALGCCRFITGLGKKVMIANNMALVADNIYMLNDAAMVPVSLAWLGSFAYTFQIFFDFSAYSDMAIGLGLMFGFKYEENFNYPYISKSMTEFWKRWHISLSNWFRSYVYFPLGGSRVKNKDIMVRNLFIVWLLTGIWHGASWTFILWGMWNLVFILFEKIIDFDRLKLNKWVRHFYTLSVVNFGWVLFRTESIPVARYYFSALFGGGNAFWSDYTYMFLKEFGIYFLLAIIFSMPIGNRMNRYIARGEAGSMLFHIGYPIALTLLFLVCVSYLVVGSYNPFIYFNF